MLLLDFKSLIKFKSSIALIVILFFALGLYAQQQPSAISNGSTGKISGKVLDAATGQPISYASISLAQSSDNKEVNGTTTDDKGTFQITGIADGNYKLLIYFVSYQTKHLVIFFPYETYQ